MADNCSPDSAVRMAQYVLDLHDGLYWSYHMGMYETSDWRLEHKCGFNDSMNLYRIYRERLCNDRNIRKRLPQQFIDSNSIKAYMYSLIPDGIELSRRNRRHEPDPVITPPEWLELIRYLEDRQGYELQRDYNPSWRFRFFWTRKRVFPTLESIAAKIGNAIRLFMIAIRGGG